MGSNSDKKSVDKGELEAAEKRFKEEFGLEDEPLTPEEVYAVRRYIEEMEETIGSFVEARVVENNQLGNVFELREEPDYQRGYRKLLGIGGTND